MRSCIIKDFNNYIIYENGDVFSTGRQGNISGGQMLKQCLGKNGYYIVTLYDKDIHKTYTIHRLLGIYFIDNPENKPCIDHIDRNRQNNNLTNLRWVSIKENNNNKEIPRGSICMSKTVHNNKTYEYIKFSWHDDNSNKRKNKNFKTLEEAKIYQNKIYNDKLKNVLIPTIKQEF